MLITAAIYAGSTGHLNIVLVALFAAVAAVVGDNVGYFLGARSGRHLITLHVRVLRLDDEKLAVGRYFFRRHGVKVVFFGRFVSVLRTCAAVLAGTNRMPWNRFCGPTPPAASSGPPGTASWRTSSGTRWPASAAYSQHRHGRRGTGWCGYLNRGSASRRRPTGTASGRRRRVRGAPARGGSPDDDRGASRVMCRPGDAALVGRRRLPVSASPSLVVSPDRVGLPSTHDDLVALTAPPRDPGRAADRSPGTGCACERRWAWP